MSRRQPGCTVLMDEGQLVEVIARIQQMGETSHIPLLQRARNKDLNLAIATHGAPIPARMLSSERPTAIILADDHPDALGTRGWPQVRRLLQWASAAVLHGTGGQAEHYSFIAASTLALGRMLVVDMQYCRHAEWLALVEQYTPRLRVLSIIPPAGGSHPVAGAPAGAVGQ
jgi:hypothetical protein